MIVPTACDKIAKGTRFALLLLFVATIWSLCACRSQEKPKVESPTHRKTMITTEDNPSARADSPPEAHAGHGAHGHPFKDMAEYIAHLDRPERAGWQKPNGVVVTLDLEGTETIVDLGAGSGFFTFPFAKALPLGKVVAADTEPEMVRHIEARARKQGVKNVEAKQISPDDPEIPAETNLLFMCNVLHHVPNRAEWLKNLFGKLPKGARFALIEFKMGELPVGPPDAMKIPRKALIELVTEAGFVLRTEYPKLLPYQLFLEFRKP